VAARVLTAAALAALTPVQWVVAADYLSTEQAQRALFPQADHFDPFALALTPAQKERVTAAAGPQPPHRSLLAWKAMRGNELLGHVFIDEVIGRQDFITYALGIDRTGHLLPLEVLAYRESHGGEIRDAGWRGQFRGRDMLEQLRFGIDIKNIAGATLSCEHVTEGVRWIVALYEAALRP
jgi:Na+-translocating ferredoxin:NAD+ oxidoreductase subunit G